MTALVVVAAPAILAWQLKPSEPPPVTRMSHVLDDEQPLGNLARPLVAIAPEGSTIVYAGRTQLYRRQLNEWEASAIAGTDGAPTTPFFSPDGRTFGYWDGAARELRKVPLSGGTPVSVAPASGIYGASWNRDGRILYAQEDGIWRVSADGGAPEHLVRIGADEFAYGPRLLPREDALLFSIVKRGMMVGQSMAWGIERIEQMARRKHSRIAATGDGAPIAGFEPSPTWKWSARGDLNGRQIGTSPTELRALEGWLVERGVAEVVIKSTAQYWRPVWEALERVWQPPMQQASAGPCAHQPRAIQLVHPHELSALTPYRRQSPPGPIYAIRITMMDRTAAGAAPRVPPGSRCLFDLDINPAAQPSLHMTPAPVLRPEHAEGDIARLIEQQTAKIPSHWFLFGALGSMGLSLMLELSGRHRASRFVGQWPAPLLLMGIYNKVVKTLGTR